MARGSVAVTTERCKGCGFCVEFCPTHVLALSSAFNRKGYHPPHMIEPDKCSGCNLCGMYCPDFAIFGFKTAETKPAAIPAATEAPAPSEAMEAKEV
ncbi:MAG: 4Fe-4S ferredoxin [Candidatus Solibacter sp.]|nr:4Fe-4S ferredoxin [Candidatus Solibacter sp.]